MPDPIKPATTWQETQGQSFEALRAEANAQKAKRENLQPMELGKGRYKDIFKVGDRTRPELALRQTRPDGEPSGSGEVDLDTLIPKQALRDLADAYASANVGAMGEAMEGVRETITYDKDESEQLEWTGHPDRHLLVPQAQEKMSREPEMGAFLVAACVKCGGLVEIKSKNPMGLDHALICSDCEKTIREEHAQG